MSDNVRIFTDANFDEEVLRSPLPVLVDFWAGWCAPCRMIAPYVEAVAEEFAGRARVGKLDVDQNPSVANRYGIQGIPALLVFQNGTIVAQRLGAVPQAEIARMLAAQVDARVHA